ncbi:hypothetical protein KFL_000910140 [Klebsormidium nitens]|uniref:Uncharacterized protein n=1 Tax=Klebsormidium nitens TaxID=105231 RepID=A0A1Y1HT51_KLENI|nr:hypothetical protein KFL_000910140 [Klebsormidium nitens]|eukprot:GAQ81794.1 hypothetical protein KFL_000910140 [Klebsormidium nitens]
MGMHRCVQDSGVSLLRILNALIVISGILLIVLVFALAKTPTWITGWGFIVLGIVTIVIGLTGLFVKPRKSYGMFAVHAILLPIGCVGLFATAMVTFADTSKMAARLNGTGHYHISRNQARSLAWFMIAVCALEAVAFVLACMVYSCQRAPLPVDKIDPATGRRFKHLPPKRGWVPWKGRDNEERQQSKAQILGDQMRAKYSDAPDPAKDVELGRSPYAL